MPGMDETMKEYTKGTLHSGSKKGPVVKSRKQAIAIGLHEEGKSNAGGHHLRGKVSAIHEHHGGSGHAMIEVTHGKRKRSKGPNGEKGELYGHDRPTSRVALSQEDAKNYKYGQRVKVGITPDNDADDAPPAKAAAPAPKKSAKAKGKKKSGKSSRAIRPSVPTGPSRIQAAMATGAPATPGY